MVIAQYLGISVLSDAFFAAFRLPNFFRRVFAEGAFNSAFVPLFIEKMENKDGKDHEFTKNIFSLLFYSLLCFIVILQIFMPFVMKILFPGFFFEPEKSTLLISLSRITVFYLLSISLVSLCSGILNSIGKFAVPSSSPIILNLTLIFSIFFLGSFTPNYAYALSWGVFFAGIFQLIWVGYFTWKAGYLVYPQIPKINQDIKHFFKKLVPGIIGSNVLQINLLLDSIFASTTAGAVSYLYYADRVNQLPLAMIGIAIGVALLPSLSRKIKSGELDEGIRLQNKALEAGLILVMPATLALTILSHQIVSTLFERGKFGSEESSIVGMALMFYSFGLPSYVMVKVLEPAFFSRGDTKTPMKISIACLINNAVFNTIFYYFGFGFVGIIVSSVLSSYLNLFLLFYQSIKKRFFYFEKTFLKKFILILMPTIIMALSLLLLKNSLETLEIAQFIKLTLTIIIGLLIYVTSSYVSGSLKILSGVKFLKTK